MIEKMLKVAIRKPHVLSVEALLNTHKSTITFDDFLKTILRHRTESLLLRCSVHRAILATIHANSADGGTTPTYKSRPSWVAQSAATSR
jgi:hypothetical protein